MKAKKFLALFSALAVGASLCAFAACNDPSGPDDPDDSDNPNPPQITYGLTVAGRGHYIKDSDLLQDGETRWLVYTTNETSGEEDNVIAVRKAAFEEGENKGWAYGEEKIVLGGETGKWDENIGSASLVKGEFTLDSEEYGWMIAYCATDTSNETQYQIGLAVAKTPDGEWKKVSETPVIEFDGDVYGATSVGCYAPSLVNMDKGSKIRLFYTYADVYGHFARFYDFDAANLDTIELSGVNQCPNNGGIEGGDAVPMFPNADFAYDAQTGRIYAVKDVSPSASINPQYATRIQLLYIAEGELETIEAGEGWVGVRTWDSTDTPDAEYERLYGACILSDAYGHVAAGAAEIIYNVCELEADNEDYLFTQNLTTLNVTLN